MGTSGARKGYKIFSINTTIRNPKRNYDFLQSFKSFDGQIMNDINLYKYFFELVKNGIYKFSNIPESVKIKLDQDIQLSDFEVYTAIKDNPQATGLSGRVMTQLRALKDLGLLLFEESDQKEKYKISITKLGNELLKNPENAPNIYAKIMIGLQANNPCRTNLLNQSRPFLNTIFVINEVNKRWKELGNEPKGILQHEFSVFVLSMKDCDYKKCAIEIIKYRNKFRYEINNNYLLEYLKNNDILPLSLSSILKDYPDEVFRKFEMTGLIVKHGAFNYIYYNFSNYNLEKIQTILKNFINYSFIQFSSQTEYYDFQNNVTLSWEKDELIRRKIVEAKARVLNIKINNCLTLDEQEETLDRIFYNKSLSKAIDRYDFNLISKELLILSGSIKCKSKFEDISEPLRLEYLLALAIGKKYGAKGLISNIIYNEEGLPLHCAPSSKSDIIYHDKEGSYILEPTMQRGRNQQLNSETTNIIRHVKDEERKTSLVYRVMMIAPVIHADVVDYFSYIANKEKAKIATLTIERIVGLFFDNSSIIKLNDSFDKIVETLKERPISEFTDLINKYRFPLSKIEEAIN